MTLSNLTQPAAQAGRFYPRDTRSLARAVDGYLSGGRAAAAHPDPKAIVAPHAGYSYSGPVAGSAFAPWAAAKSSGAIQRVILLGPSHWVDFSGLALPDARDLATPLGEVPIDLDAVRALDDLAQVAVHAPAHETEHSLEVELPFLQQALAPGFCVVPLVVGRATDREVADVVDRLWGGPETRFVLSSDLSHYLEYEEARRVDRQSADALEALDGSQLSSARACGYRVLRGFVTAAARHRLTVTTADLRNSGDTAGPRHQVVGYGAFHFGQPECS